MTTVGKWLLHKNKLLGSGSYGDVYTASSSDSPEKVAIKVVMFTNTEEPEKVRNALKWEISVLTSLQHENIMTILDASCADDAVQFMVMPLYKCSLSDAYYRDPAPHLVVPVLKQLLLAIDYIHARGYAHCDISPNNVMIAQFPSDKAQDIKVVLCDFGSLRKVNAGGIIDAKACKEHHLGSWCATCVWTGSPECRSPDNQIIVDSQGCDVWAATTTALSANGIWHKNSGWWRDAIGPLFDRVFNENKHHVLAKFVPTPEIACTLAALVFQPQIFRASAAKVLEALQQY